ncbi:Penicillin-binding protein [Propionibacterium freudenreichii]|uniref:peptidoglycan D,D-transpeptidase FtsI family protein n=1 Tax=Propionibacterium freudenreichii TaxID=1744 RepID=UPI00054238A2|nr:penicillin-binding protein 2 [Propionibacterium freudenreichii]CEH09109.1 Penicillin-binding protein [Propionibacterium freudenreichii]
MNKSLRGVSLIAAIMFLALLVNATFNYGFRSKGLNDDPSNRRVTDSQFNTDRGSILASNTPIAQSVAVSGNRFSTQRTYSNGALYAPVTGFYSYIYGRTGLEQSYNSQLSGQDDSQFFSRMIDEATGKNPQGATVQTTINPAVQQAASDALGGRTGAVVAYDYATGAILGWVTSPSYDPSQLSSVDLPATQTAWQNLVGDPSNPMSDRATQQIYPPGSTFKLVVASAALENGKSAASTVSSPVTLPLPNTNRVLPNAVNCGGSTSTIDHALTVSCNTAFANLGMELGADKIRAQADKFGFESPFTGDFTSATSTFPAQLDASQLAMSSIGQYDVSATPLQMAVVAGALANDGNLMQPYVVSEVRDRNLNVLTKHDPQSRGNAVSKETAASMQNMMVHVVQSGTGTATQIAGQTIGGKTGTAENLPGASDYSWFAGFDKEHHVALSVFLANPNQAGSATGNATVAAKRVFQAVQS